MFSLDPIILYVGLGQFYIMCIQYEVTSTEFSCPVTARLYCNFPQFSTENNFIFLVTLALCYSVSVPPSPIFYLLSIMTIYSQPLFPEF